MVLGHHVQKCGFEVGSAENDGIVCGGAQQRLQNRLKRPNHPVHVDDNDAAQASHEVIIQDVNQRTGECHVQIGESHICNIVDECKLL
eukprot:CAMPEP_0197688282 /NCGR_PEP_ID=MMETSP1338-20131121/105195_1 /TAXON_ID=43686 ORGANISM="Pelagodinium beii, Strain RCC1491" /NCGR_SAMPLE_ID=MMETSP1338 /ASSEMBLY_ACC=CAM_ASM_000754 /LENGTH=87 /DNA_ID=CAMNT_0043270475 /DNA_START=392 /DNA_END=652 /DNA_ORIENTATION=-